jgi:transcriptional regulator with XRE-family HTH domain
MGGRDGGIGPVMTADGNSALQVPGERRTEEVQGIKMEPGRWIRSLREERMIKPSDVERITRSFADAKGNADFYVSHSTLADIEAGSTPSIHKLFSLALCLRVPLDEVLLPFGIDPAEVKPYRSEPVATEAPTVQIPSLRPPPFRFQLKFDMNFSAEETTLLSLQTHDLENLPGVFQARFDPLRYRYAVIGSRDDGMADLLPPRSIVEVDKAQNTVQTFPWQTLRDRPIYLVWHGGGHMCRWCQIDGRELLLVPHPVTQHSIRRFRTPGEATVIGRVTGAWLPFESVEVRRENVS